MRAATRKLLCQSQVVGQLALKIIEEKGYVIAYDIEDKEARIPWRAASNLLNANADEWGLDSWYKPSFVHGYSTSGSVKVYTRKGEDPPETVDLSNYRYHMLPPKIPEQVP